MISKESFIEGKTILIDKPIGWTSFDVVKKIRGAIKEKYGIKKIKVGHAGTLDPLATGLLVICIGKHTKKIQSYIDDKKTYSGVFLIGKTTPSFDLETAFNKVFSIDNINMEKLALISQNFIGKQTQTPPIFSAKKINGKRAYELARKGEEVHVKKAEIEIYDFKLNIDLFPKVSFSITCSKGTYIRSIVSDFGKALNNGATLIELRRMASGKQNILDAKTVEEFISSI